ncbi:MAG: hypothetical protein GY847_31255 [Proteobacteria bacterium]|nr:hypothetical protein [Pseudomonadota bacterium]
MTGISRRQARILRRQISSIYPRRYIALRTGDSTLTIGDVLATRRDTLEIVDSSQLPAGAIEYNDGNKINHNIISSSDMSLSFKPKGHADSASVFDKVEAGISVEFESKNDLFLKVQGMRQRTLVNFHRLRNEILSRFTRGDIGARVHVVRGLIIADRYFMQFGSRNGGKVALLMDASFEGVDAALSAPFNLKWTDRVGYTVDAPKGGPLAYRVSSVRVRRHLRPRSVETRILDGLSEAEAMESLTADERAKLADEDALDLVDTTSSLIDELTDL